MLRLKGRGTGTGWSGMPFVAMLVIAAAILWVAPAAVANADNLIFLDETGVRHTLKFDVGATGALENVTIDGNPATATQGHIKGVRAIQGSGQGKMAIVFDGSTCIFISGHWIGYPPGTRCP